MLKRLYKTASEIPENVKSLYAEKNGEWHLQVEEDPRVSEFRDNNVELKKKVDALQSQLAEYGDLKPDKVKELAKKQADIEAGKLVESGKLDEAVKKATEAMKAEHEKVLSDLKNKYDTAAQQLSRLTIDKALIEAGAKYGLRQSAHDDLVNRGRAIFRLLDGVPVALEEDGKTKKYGKDGKELTVEEYVEILVEKAPHLFEASRGGGSGGGGGTALAGGNPWKTGNLTQQSKLARENPQLAAQMKAEAGVR